MKAHHVYLFLLGIVSKNMQIRGESSCLNQTVIQLKFLNYKNILHENNQTIMNFVLENLIPKYCCNTTRFELIPKSAEVNSTTQWADMMEIDNEKQHFTFYFPTYALRGRKIVFDEYKFVRVVRSPGLAVLAQVITTSRGVQIVGALKSAWQFLLCTLLLAITAGFIAWICECRLNEEQFSSSFFSGSWQGFWWAMVTMTTVGYGDKSPVTVLGRIFTVAWMFASSITMSILTAHLTSSLTTDEIGVSSTEDYIGMKMGIRVGSKDFFQNEFDLGANYQEITSTEEAFGGLKDGSLPRFLSDDYTTVMSSSFSDIKVENIFRNPLDVGIAIVGREECDMNKVCKDRLEEFTECFMKTTTRYFLKVNREKENDIKTPDKDSSSYFDTYEMHVILCSLGGVIASILLLGSLWEMANNLKRRRTMKRQTDHDVEMGRVETKEAYPNISFEK